MTAEIQTSLLLLTAEIAAVTTVAALVAAGVAWARGRARLKAAQALRDAAARLPGEGEVVHKERELLGEFARAYLTRDAEVLAGLPARLLSLRQVIEAAAVPAAPEVDPAQVQAMEALEVERARLQAKVEGLEQQYAQTQQHLDTALGTINALVQEYGRGRGQEVAPTAAALLQSLLQIGAAAPAFAAAGGPASAEDAASRPDIAVKAGAQAEEEAMMDLSIDDQVVVGDQGEPPAPGEPEAAPVASVPISSVDIDAMLEDVLGASAVEPKSEAASGEEAVRDVAVTPPQAEGFDDQGLDLSVPVESPPAHGPEREYDAPVPSPDKAGKDELDELDIEALLDAELGRQATLLSPPAGDEDFDLARPEVSGPGIKKIPPGTG
ncbi:MAG: hypothetical protein ACP5IY_00390 [Halothiobacillaceae bacterium]